MKMSKITVAMGALFGALVAGQAMAAISVPTGSTVLTLYASGSSAQDGGILGAMRYVCAAPGGVSTLNVYTASNQALYTCTADSAKITMPTGKSQIVLYKSSVGGSGNGVQPVARANAVNTVPFIDAAGTTCAAATSVAASGSLVGYSKSDCSAGLVNANVLPDVGYSDVEPAQFGYTGTNLQVILPVNHVIFGTPVTKNLRDALQAAQGLTVGADDEANMPSLTKTQIASLLTGYVTTWDMFASRTGAAITLPADLTVYLSRRVSTSGTEKTSEIYFLNQNCTPNVAPIQTGNDATACGATGVPNSVNEGSGGGNVVACLNTHNAAGRYAIGLLSTEVVVKPTDGFRFIKIGGQAPTLLNVADGRYDFYAEQTAQISGAIAASDPKSVFFTAFVNKMGVPAVVAAIDNTLTQTVGGWNGGLMALGLNYPVNAPMDESTPSALLAAQAAMLANPVNTTTKSPNGVPNNCIPPVEFNATVATHQ